MAAAKGATTPTGTVTFTLDGNLLGAPVKLFRGKAKTKPVTVLAPGTHRVTASYSGNSQYRGSKAKMTETVSCARTRSHKGLLKVTGSTCVDHATVNGPVIVAPGGHLALVDAIVRGPVHATGAAETAVCGSSIIGPVTVTTTRSVVLGGGTGSSCSPDKIEGTLTVQRALGRVDVQRLTVTGAVVLRGNVAGVNFLRAPATGPLGVVDNKGGVAVTGNKVHGALTITRNTGPLAVKSNNVSGIVDVSSNTSASASIVAGNLVAGGLVCDKNVPAPALAGVVNKVARAASGQCAKLA